MAGTATTTRFMLSTATLMLGPMANLYDLQPATNSVGMVKNVTLSSDPAFADLTQGRFNTVVFTSMTGNPVKISAELYEYTVQNLGYALGLDGSALTTQTHAPYKLSGNSVGGENTLTFVGVGGINVGDTMMFVDRTVDDRVLVRKVTAVNSGSNQVTFDRAIPGIWTVTADIVEANAVPIGTTQNAPFFACKIVGQLVDGSPAVAMFPKVRITKGFTMAWNSEQYGNMPLEFQVMDLVPTDTFYANFPNRKGELDIQ